jgi:integration host factor subunit beta
MTKSDLIELLAGRAGRSRRDTEAAVNAVFDTLAGALSKSERVEIRGFGAFGIRRRGARPGRNPRTGAQVAVPERKSPFFTVAKELRARVNNGHGGRNGDGK